MNDEFNIDDFIENNIKIVHFTEWKKFKDKELEVYIPMLTFNMNTNFNTPIILDEAPSAGSKFINTGLLENNQFLRIFVNKDDCEDYLKFSGLNNVINEDIKFGKSYLNYFTFSGSYGSNDIKVIFDNCKRGRLGPVNLEDYLHHLSLEMTIKTIEACLFFKPSFLDTNWYKQLHDSFGITEDNFTPTKYNELKDNLNDIWDRYTIYEFLIKNNFMNLKFIFDFGYNNNHNISPRDICDDIPNNTGEIHLSHNSFIFEHIDYNNI